MNNREVAGVLADIARLLELEGGDAFRIRAYRKAACSVETLPGDVNDYRREERLEEIPGVGKRIGEVIAELLDTGGSRYYEALKRQYPRQSAPVPLYRAMGVAAEALCYMRDCGFRGAEAAGGVRRRAPMVWGVSLVGSSEAESPLDCFIHSPLVALVEEESKGRAKVVTRYGVEAALDVVDSKDWGLHLLFATGSEKHLERLAEHAASRGISLSREGFVDAVTLQRKKFAAEEDLYKTLGLDYIPPELREGRGEIEAAAARAIPRLVERKDVRGDLHVHSRWSDGASSIQDIAMAARALGYEYVAICDHSRSLTVASGLSVERLREQMAEIDRLNDTLEGFTVLRGIEVDIKADGSLDMPDDVLEELDIVVASVPSGMRGERDVITGRALRALESPYVTILGHPTGRILGGPMQVDMDKVIESARANGKALELNACPGRLDLSDEDVRRAVEAGVPIAIDTDARSLFDLDFMEYGVHAARRGWASGHNILNALAYDGLLRFLSGRP